MVLVQLLAGCMHMRAHGCLPLPHVPQLARAREEASAAKSEASRARAEAEFERDRSGRMAESVDMQRQQVGDGGGAELVALFAMKRRVPGCKHCWQGIAALEKNRSCLLLLAAATSAAFWHRNAPILLPPSSPFGCGCSWSP